MAETVAHRWHPLEDYPQFPDSLASSELRRLALVWNKHELTQREALERFNERLRREWAIDTGLSERVYTLDRSMQQMPGWFLAFLAEAYLLAERIEEARERVSVKISP